MSTRDALRIPLDELPESVQELAETIGERAALRLVEAHGGTDFYVPRRVTSALEALLGAEAAQALVDNYHAGSDRLKLPRCAAAARAALRQRIVAAYCDGATAAELARDFGFTERWIYQILRKRRDELASKQASLF